jgi:hypothetical protein
MHPFRVLTTLAIRFGKRLWSPEEGAGQLRFEGSHSDSRQIVHIDEFQAHPSSNSKMSAEPESVVRTRKKAQERARASLAPILVDAATAAAALSISERAFHSLRKRSDFPQNATVVLGPRCVRFHLEALHTFTLSLVSIPQRDARQPRRSRRVRPEKGAAADVKAL